MSTRKKFLVNISITLEPKYIVTYFPPFFRSFSFISFSINITLKCMKVHIFWEGHKNMTKSSHFFDTIKVISKKKVWRFRQILKATFSECMNLTSIWRKRNIYQGYRKVWKFGGASYNMGAKNLVGRAVRARPVYIYWESLLFRSAILKCKYFSESTSKIDYIYRKIASSNTSRLEAHVGYFRLLMKGIFGP